MTTDEEARSSELRVRNITDTDAGNYTCKPSNAAPAFVTVKVTKGELSISGLNSREFNSCVICILS